MNGVDGLILGVGVIVLAASIVGVMLYDEEGGTPFQVRFQEGEATELDALSDSGGPGEVSFDVGINESALATVSFLVDVTANGQQVSDDTVTVEVTGPGGATEQCQFTIGAGPLGSGAGSCTADLLVQEQPGPVEVQATNSSQAQAIALERVDLAAGQGTYTVTVTIDGGQELQEPSYAIDVTPSFTVYEPLASALTPGAVGP